jgi:hypothetical protein
MALIAVVMALQSRETAKPDRERRIAAVLIGTATREVAMACRELEEIDLKAKNLEIARQLGETELLNAFRKQIQEKEANTLDALSGYGEILRSLAEIERATVLEEFDRHAHHLVATKLFRQVQALRLVQEDYQKPGEGRGESLNLDAMRGRCREK